MIKKLQILLLATVAIMPLAAKKDKDAVLDSINQRAAYIAKLVTEINEKEKCTYEIHASDIGTTGYVISSPGTYCLVDDVVFNPSRDPIAQTPVTFTGGGGSGAVAMALVSGGVVRSIDIVNSGSGYTSAPTISIGGSGTEATATAAIGGITTINGGGGSGYIGQPTVTISGSGSGAKVEALVDGNAVVGFQILNAGSGYAGSPVTVTITGGGGTGASATADVSSGISGATVTNGGSGYTDTVVAAITIASSKVNLLLGDHYLGQAGVDSEGNVSSTQSPYVVGIVVPDVLPFDTNGSVQSFAVTGEGSGYTSAPTVTIAAPTTPGGVTATAVAAVAGGIVTGIRVVDGGSGYISNPTVTLSGGGGSGATAIANIYNLNAIGLESICITGDQAIIDGFSYMGVRIFAHTVDIRLSNLTIKNCGKLASAAVRPYVGYTAIQSQGSYATGTIGLAIGEQGVLTPTGTLSYSGPYFFTTYSGLQSRISNVVLDNVTCLNNFTFGMNLSNVTNAYVNNCHFDGTFNDTQYTVFGAYCGTNSLTEFPSNINVIFKNSTFNGSQLLGNNMLYSTAPGGAGCAGTGSRDMAWMDCEFNNNANTCPGATIWSGFLGSVSFDYSFVNCSFNGNSGTNVVNSFHTSGLGGAAPFGSSGSSITLIDCVSENNSQNGNLQLPAPIIVPGSNAVGFALDFSKSNYVQNCNASNIYYNGPISAAVGSLQNGDADGAYGILLSGGFNPQADAQDYLFDNCYVSRVVTSNGGPAVGFCIDHSASQVIHTITFDECTSNGNLALVPTLTIASASQGVAVGFLTGILAQEGAGTNAPVVYNNCLAASNQGAPAGVFIAPFYSAGFYARCLSAETALTGHFFYNCEAIDNVYGFLLANCSSCAVRNCRSDNNVASDNITGEGFTDLGPAGMPSGVGISTSLFEGNHAYNNGNNDTTYFGQNSNYNVLVTGTQTTPIFEVQVSSPTTSYMYINPAPSSFANFNPNVYNISTIK